MSFGMSMEAMKKELAGRLKKSRFQHSLGVADTAVFLAKRFGADVEKAAVAGLLHDCAREFTNESMINEAVKRNIPVGTIEQAMPLLLHAHIGACRVREIYQVDDPAVEQAIRRHTVAAPAMTELDKIIWFADMIEPGRDYPEVERLRDLSRTASLNDMVLEGLSQSIKFVVEKGHLIHPDTVLARNELLLRNNCECKGTEK